MPVTHGVTGSSPVRTAYIAKSVFHGIRFLRLRFKVSDDIESFFLFSMDEKRYLLTLIREGEHQQQDFKYRVSDACKLAKSVSAFANTDGGRLLIGVRDDGVLSGVRSEEEIYMMHQAAYKYCRPEADTDLANLQASDTRYLKSCWWCSPSRMRLRR